MSTRGLYTFVGEWFPGYTDHRSGKKHKPTQAPSWNVYKHSDNYPTGAAGHIAAALAHAWPLPRYEADEFAAAFIAANKNYWQGKELETLRKLAQYQTEGGTVQEIAKTLADLQTFRDYLSHAGGNIRLMPQGKPLAVAQKNCADIEWRYEIYVEDQPSGVSVRSSGLSTPREKGKAPEDILHVRCFEIGYTGEGFSGMTDKCVFAGSLRSFTKWAEDREAAERAADAQAEAREKAKAAKKAGTNRRKVKG